MSVECLKQDNNNITCKFIGKIDTIKYLENETIIMDTIGGAEKIVFDLGSVDYISSSFLRLCGKVSHEVGEQIFL